MATAATTSKQYSDMKSISSINIQSALCPRTEAASSPVVNPNIIEPLANSILAGFFVLETTACLTKGLSDINSLRRVNMLRI